LYDVYRVAFASFLTDAAVALNAPIRHASLPPFALLFLLLSAPLCLLQRHLFAVLIALVAF
jgi:hypothetical protein